jgi:isochorismate synthase
MQINECIVKIDELLDLCLANKLIFAAYRLPGQTEINIVIQNDRELYELEDIAELTYRKGFLVAPFYAGSGEKTYLIRPDIHFRNEASKEQLQKLKELTASFINGTEYIGPEETTREVLIHQVEEAVNTIKKGEFQKAVLSRIKIVKGEYISRLSKIFQLLSDSYSNSFVYLFRIKDHCWIGATPEPFICSSGDELTTVSLAGTRPFKSSNLEINNWNHKELKEQENVTNYIENVLGQFKISTFNIKGPYVKKAGHLLHLRTDFTFPLQSLGSNLYAFIAALHPTSAICGMPLEKTREFILNTEKHNREYYAGLVGPVGIDQHLQLFVNLRCMKVYPHQLVLYTGGGITADSVPKDEWEETEIKTETLMSVVQQIE